MESLVSKRSVKVSIPRWIIVRVVAKHGRLAGSFGRLAREAIEWFVQTKPHITLREKEEIEVEMYENAGCKGVRVCFTIDSDELNQVEDVVVREIGSFLRTGEVIGVVLYLFASRVSEHEYVEAIKRGGSWL